MQAGQASKDAEEKGDRSVQQQQCFGKQGVYGNRQGAQSHEEQTGAEKQGYQGDQYQSRRYSDRMDGAKMK
jgi:hypothetical protein